MYSKYNKILRNIGIPAKLVEAIKTIYTDANNVIRIDRDLYTKSIRSNRGIQQGDRRALRALHAIPIPLHYSNELSNW
jgi:hypothetical protein